jgi:hypothetical protein
VFAGKYIPRRWDATAHEYVVIDLIKNRTAGTAKDAGGRGRVFNTPAVAGSTRG